MCTGASGDEALAEGCGGARLGAARCGSGEVRCGAARRRGAAKVRRPEYAMVGRSGTWWGVVPGGKEGRGIGRVRAVR